MKIEEQNFTEFKLNNSHIKKIAAAILILFSISASLTAKEYKITKHENSMFWTIDSTDRQGSPSRIYVLGTIHLADETLYPVPDYILEAWEDADVVYGEISSKDWSTYMAQFTSFLMLSAINDGFDIEDELSDEDIALIKKTLGIANYNNFKKFEPWVMSTTLSGQALKSNKLSAEYSYDIFFIKKANEEGIEMLGLDPLKTQLEVLSYGNRDDQIKLLKDAVESLKDLKTAVNDVEKLYEAYTTGDTEYFTKAYFSQLEKEIERETVYKGYYEAMLINRNRKWAKKFKDILDEGGVTFIFAGAGHFTGNDSVFEMLKKDSMSIERDIEAYNMVKERKQINPFEY